MRPFDIWNFDMNLLALSLIGFAPVIYYLKSPVVIKRIKETPTEPGCAASIKALTGDGPKQEHMFEHVGQCVLLTSARSGIAEIFQGDLSTGFSEIFGVFFSKTRVSNMKISFNDTIDIR